MTARVRQAVKQLPLVPRAVRFVRDTLVGAAPERGLHGDDVYRGMMARLLARPAVTSFIETGTCLGDTTSFVAGERPDLPVFTCEIAEEYFKRSARRLRPFANVQLRRESSKSFLPRLLASGRPGRLPLCFFDAHWYDYWPLGDEVRAVSEHGGPAVMVIDDFFVPGEPQFSFDEYEGRPCDWDLIAPHLARRSSYGLLYPRYSEKEARRSRPDCLVRGHLVLFQNLDAELRAFAEDPFIARHYRVEAPRWP